MMYASVVTVKTVFKLTNRSRLSFPVLLVCHMLLCFRHSADEPMVRMQHKVSGSLKQALEKLKLSENTADKKGENTTLFCPLCYRLPPSTSCSSRQEGHDDTGS